MFSVSVLALSAVTLLVSSVAPVEAQTFGVAEFLIASAVTVLLALSGAAVLGANGMLLTFIPLHFGKIGRASTVTGMLNAFSYAAASVSGVVVGAISKNSGWVTAFCAFIGIAAAGGIICLAGHRPMKRKTDELDSLDLT
jgi:sugar phosphate permease